MATVRVYSISTLRLGVGRWNPWKTVTIFGGEGVVRTRLLRNGKKVKFIPLSYRYLNFWHNTSYVLVLDYVEIFQFNHPRMFMHSYFFIFALKIVIRFKVKPLQKIDWSFWSLVKGGRGFNLWLCCLYVLIVSEKL